MEPTDLDPSTWLIRVARNVCREFNRRRRGEALDEAFEPTADDDHERRDDIAQMRRWLARLPARQKEVVSLRYLEELSVEETARAMACRPGTVKALLHKAMARLKELEQLSHGY